MSEYPQDFEFDALMKDGRPIHFRPIRPDDAQREKDFFEKVGAESSYFRFHRMKSDLSPEELRYFTSVDYDDRMAFIALFEEEMVGVGRYDVLSNPCEDCHKVAEVAFLVRDDFQGRGIGSQLLQHLTVYARLKGITEFEAFVLTQNRAMLRVFRASGYKLTRALEEGVYRVEYPIEYSLEAREAEWEHEKRAVTASLMPILYPASIAVIGASRNRLSIGGRLFHNLLAQSFEGPLYPVNPGADFVHAVKAYPTVGDIPDPVDLAIITVPAAAVLGVVEECGEKGVKGVVIISAGFGEVGGEGSEVEQKIVTMARRYGMRLVGPNCMGLINTDSKASMDGQFGPTFPPAGNVAMSSQSGALGLAILEQATKLNIGISTFVSLGNRADVSPDDLLLYWKDDPASDVIVLYMESFGNPRRFGRLARRVSRAKPIVVVKAGRSTAGARAAASHTGSLASLDVAVDALFHQSGVIRTDTLLELFDVTTLLANQPLPKGRRVALLSNAGGPAILAADALERQGLILPELSSELQAKLGEYLRSDATTRNPVDMVASAGPDEYDACLSLLLDSDEVDSVIVIFIPTAPEGNREVIMSVRDAVATHSANRTDDTAKTVLGVFMGSTEGTEVLADVKLPIYPYPESAARALASVIEYAEWRETPEGEFVRYDDVDRVDSETVLRDALGRIGDEAGWLDAAEVDRLLSNYGINTVRTATARSEDEAVAIAADMGTPVALKVISSTVVHKSDVGGVVLDVSGEDAVREAYRQVMSVADDSEGAVIQQFLEGGHEVIVGMSEDALFGPLIVFGLGGIFVELMKDVSFRINPLTDVDAKEMLTEVRSANLLTGYRGEPAGDVEALQEVILRVSALVENHPEILEMDLNPVKVFEPGKGVSVVDARIRVRPVDSGLLPSRKDIPGRLV